MSVVGVLSTHIVVKLSTVSLNFCDHFYPSHILLNHSTVTDKARWPKVLRLPTDKVVRDTQKGPFSPITIKKKKGNLDN